MPWLKRFLKLVSSALIGRVGDARDQACRGKLAGSAGGIGQRAARMNAPLVGVVSDWICPGMYTVGFPSMNRGSLVPLVPT